MISRSHGNSCRPGNRTYGRSLSQNPGRRSVPVRIGAIRGAAGRCVRFRAGRMLRFSVPCGCRSVRSCAGERFVRSDMRLSAAVRRGRSGRQKASSACFHRGGRNTVRGCPFPHFFSCAGLRRTELGTRSSQFRKIHRELENSEAKNCILQNFRYICTPDSRIFDIRYARMAESVDALVSNTNDSNVVPVRPRLRVLSRSAKSLINNVLALFLFPSRPHRDRKSPKINHILSFFLALGTVLSYPMGHLSMSSFFPSLFLLKVRKA